GTITLASLAGLSFSVGDGTGDATMQFSGTQASINAALEGLRFAPAANYSGPAQLQLAVNDLGNSGAGGPLTANGTVAIDVAAVNDAPTISLPAGQTMNSLTLTFSTATGNAIVISDVDSGTVEVTLQATGGTLTLGATSGVTLLA